MCGKDAKPNQAERERGASEDGRSSGGPSCCDMVNSGGPNMAEMMKACCGGSGRKRCRIGFWAMAAGLGLALLISQVGGILGIIAFFRTF